MHPEDIKATLRKHGKTQADIARAEKVSKAMVSYVVVGHSLSRRIAEAIATACELPVDVLWPGRYPTQADTAAKPAPPVERRDQRDRRATRGGCNGR